LLVDRVFRQGRRYDFRVVRCGRCDFVYVTPRGQGEILGNQAGGAARRDAAIANAPIYGRGLAALRAAGMPEGAHILDLGCARGDFMAYAAARGYRLTGVDLNPRLADEARARGFSVHTGDLRELNLDLRVDALTMWDVIEHVDAPVEVLAACRHVLAPGGLVFFHTGNASFQIPKARILNRFKPGGGPYLIPYQHLSHFDPDSARSAMARAGLEPVSVFFAGTLHYPDPKKRLAMQAINALGSLPARFGGPLLTNAMGVVGRRVD
jgi:SAM-dependent methyltransferase